MSRPWYRVWQFFVALRARPLDDERKEIAEYLPGPALALFATMPVGDQRHSYAIFRTLIAQGRADRPLLQAALLHDVAKARLGLWQRSVVVLLNAISPSLLPRLASADPRSWRYPFYVSLRHPDMGAQEAERVGLDPRAVVLIRRHQSPPEEQADPALVAWQKALKALDDRS